MYEYFKSQSIYQFLLTEGIYFIIEHGWLHQITEECDSVSHNLECERSKIQIFWLFTYKFSDLSLFSLSSNIYWYMIWSLHIFGFAYTVFSISCVLHLLEVFDAFPQSSQTNTNVVFTVSSITTDPVQIK